MPIRQSINIYFCNQGLDLGYKIPTIRIVGSLEFRIDKLTVCKLFGVFCKSKVEQKERLLFIWLATMSAKKFELGY